MNETNKIECCDCGASVEGKGKPKEVAKKYGWSHAATGKWHCKECSDFIKKMNRQEHVK